MDICARFVTAACVLIWAFYTIFFVEQVFPLYDDSCVNFKIVGISIAVMASVIGGIPVFYHLLQQLSVRHIKLKWLHRICNGLVTSLFFLVLIGSVILMTDKGQRCAILVDTTLSMFMLMIEGLTLLAMRWAPTRRRTRHSLILALIAQVGTISFGEPTPHPYRHYKVYVALLALLLVFLCNVFQSLLAREKEHVRVIPANLEMSQLGVDTGRDGTGRDGIGYEHSYCGNGWS